MKELLKMRSYQALMGFAAIAFASGAFADVSMVLVGPPPGPSLDGVYTSPYQALIGPANEDATALHNNGVLTNVICDDFTTDVSLATPVWQATVTSLGAFNGSTEVSTVKFGDSSAAQQTTDYMTAAYLAEELMGVNQATPAGQLIAGQLSFAIWEVFAKQPVLNWLSGDPTNAPIIAKYLSDAQTAVAHDTPGQFANVLVYTPNPNGASQEYLVVTPEPPAKALLAVDMSALGGLLFLLRKKLFRAPVQA
jgi:hypothetical protein